MSTAESESAAAAAAPVLLRETRDAIAFFTLNRPQSRNALSDELLSELARALAAAAVDDKIRVVVLRGAGPAFCAGHDLRETRAKGGIDAWRDLFLRCSAVMKQIVRLPKPVIAQAHGVASAAGCQLVASCDLALAEENARFAAPGVHIGLFCSTPMVALSRKVGQNAAMEMLLTGAPIGAARAREIGLINDVAPAGELDERVERLAQAVAAKPPRVVKIGKEAFYRQAEMDLDAAYDYASEVMARNMTAPEAAEGIDAFIEKRAPVWPV